MTSQPVDYLTKPLALFTVKDLTDAIGVERSAEVLNTSRRVIYSVRCSGSLGESRASALIAEIRTDEAMHRQRLVVIRNLQLLRAEAAVSA